MSEQLSIIFTNSVKYDLWSDYDELAVQYHSFLTLGSKPGSSKSAVKYDPVQEMHFGPTKTKWRKNKYHLMGGPCAYRRDKPDTRSLQYEYEIWSGETTEAWRKWLEITLLASQFSNMKVPFVSVQDVLNKTAGHTSNCWDAVQSIIDATFPGVELMDHNADHVQRGWHAIAAKIKEKHFLENINVPKEISLEDMIKATEDHFIEMPNHPPSSAPQ